MEEKIIEIMKRVFNTCDITTSTDQRNCDQWDSLRHLNLIVEIEDEFDIEFEPEEIGEMKSFNAVKTMVASKI